LFEQLKNSVLDMAWHRAGAENVVNVEVFENDVQKKYLFLPHTEGTSVSTMFKHIFHGGYSAGYYSYHFAEVLAADAFEYFKENGLFSKELATKFREHILSKGNTEAPDELYRAFRGRDADPKALFRLKGLL
jgi:peptidyl-dipeptidase Dcp